MAKVSRLTWTGGRGVDCSPWKRSHSVRQSEPPSPPGVDRGHLSRAVGLVEARRTSGVPSLPPRAGWRLDPAEPSSWSTIFPDSLGVLQEPPEKSCGGWGRLPASRTKRKTQPPRARPTRIAHLPRAMCGALGGVVSEGSRTGRRVASWGAGAHRGESWSAGPPMPPARHCTRQTRPQRGPGARLLRAPRPCGQQAVCVRLCVCATYVREIHPRAVQDHAWLVSAAGGAAPSEDGRGFPPPHPPWHPALRLPVHERGIKFSWLEKIFFFLSFCLCFSFFLVFKNPVVFLSRQRPAPGSAGPWVAARAVSRLTSGIACSGQGSEGVAAVRDR